MEEAIRKPEVSVRRSAPARGVPVRLQLEDGEVLAGAEAASRLSLRLFDPEGAPLRQGALCHQTTVTLADREVVLSRARVEASEDGGFSLVFLDEVYDCRELIEKGTLTNLRGFFRELPLVLGHKEQIVPAFRSFVADLGYDLSVFKRFFDEQDRILAQEPPAVAAAAQQVLLDTAGREFFHFFDAQLSRMTELVRDFTPEEHERHGYYLRQAFWHFILGSEFMKRTNLKPRGYAGDHVMMQMLYDNTWVGNFAFHKLLHKHPVEQPAAQAVRNRRRLIPRVLHQVLDARPAGTPFRVMSVACGPARELEDVFRTPDDARRIQLSLVDQDEDALGCARASLERVAQAQGPIQSRFLTDSVRTMLRTHDLPARFGHFDFIYSMGLFDYLSPPVARAVLEKLYAMLSPGGVVLVGNYHVANPNRYYMAYWLDWTLYHRDEEEMRALAARLEDAKVEVDFDETRCQMFLRVERRS